MRNDRPRRRMRKLLVIIAMLTATISARSQMLAVSTDAPWLLMQTPNIGAELVVGNRSTLLLSAFGNYKPWGKDMKMLGVQPEYRYFFSGRPMHSMFVGAGAVAASYDITWAGKVYDGSCTGIGLTFGYVWSIRRRLNIDFHAGVGLIFYNQKEYFTGDNFDNDYAVDGEQRTNANGYTLLPTRIGVSVSYILK